jgi:hypothetical protein
MDMGKPDGLTATQAAHNLALKVPDTDAGYWRSFLANNRKKGRSVGHRIPFRKVGSRVYYDREDLTAFAAKEREHRAAVQALAEAPERSREGGTRAVKWSVDARQVPGAVPSVKLRLTTTIAVPLTPSQARELAADLLQFANRFQDTERK